MVVERCDLSTPKDSRNRIHDSEKLTQKLKVNTLRFYVAGLNLLTWSGFDYWDPELGNGRGAVYPIQKNINVGVNISL
jgi:hypothetical protein